MRLAQVHIFTKLDIRGAYNLIRIREGDEWKTVFRTQYGLLESLVELFRLTNVPATFQDVINNTLSPNLDNLATAYMDDILIYSNNLQVPQDHVKKILAAPTKQGLHLKPDKCEFHMQEVKPLGLIVSTEGINMEQAKVGSIREWPTSEREGNVRAFLCFANFY